MSQLIWGQGFFGWIVPFLLILSVVVFFHELGHFLVARWAGVKVLVFSLGFGRELAGFTDRHGTRWKIAAVPLGGYVKFFGDESAASTPSNEALAEMTPEEREKSFHHKKVGPRAAIIAAGPVANFILGIVIFAVVALIYGKAAPPDARITVLADSVAEAAGFRDGDRILRIDDKAVTMFQEIDEIAAASPGVGLNFEVRRGDGVIAIRATPKVQESPTWFGLGPVRRVGILGLNPLFPARIAVVPRGAAESAGLKTGDMILRIGDKPIASFEDMRRIVAANPGVGLSFEVRRGDGVITLTVTPKESQSQSGSAAAQRSGMIGVSPQVSDEDMLAVGPLEALTFGADRVWYIITGTLGGIGKLFAGSGNAHDVAGVIGIAQMSGDAASMGLPAVLGLCAILSVSIGLLNLFPIPLLDGGHLLFCAAEAVRGRPLSERVQEIGFRIGLALVVLLMVFATYNDILRQFGLL
ncbi:MAG: RIP metalloprotease RseP [Alphaproteobacteria bacterium]|nr:RIP metalloprotease RseP [Alphaproteobacteria bacterium]